jgi:fucose permease
VEFTRDRLTWLAYVLIAWFAFLQAVPGLVVPHLREELDLSYSVGGLHVGAFAAGSVVAGLGAAAAERALGRRRLLWAAAALLAAGAVALTLGRVAAATLGAMLVMGFAGAMVVVTLQAALADRHLERRAVALSEANVAASIAYVILIGALSLAAAIGAGWRAAVLSSLVVPVLAWSRNRELAVTAPASAPPGTGGGRLPPAFWVAAAMLFCTTAAEWCITAWGATFVEDAAGVSVDTAVALMAGFFGGVLGGRVLGSVLARRYTAHRLLAAALIVSASGFAVLWPASSPLQAVVGLAACGVGLGNLFPLGVAVTVGLAPDRTQLASGRAVLAGGAAVLVAPLAVGALADATTIKAALGTVVPLSLALAAAALTLVTRAASRAGEAPLAERTRAAGRAARRVHGTHRSPR